MLLTTPTSTKYVWNDALVFVGLNLHCQVFKTTPLPRSHLTYPHQPNFSAANIVVAPKTCQTSKTICYFFTVFIGRHNSRPSSSAVSFRNILHLWRTKWEYPARVPATLFLGHDVYSLQSTYMHILMWVSRDACFPNCTNYPLELLPKFDQSTSTRIFTPARILSAKTET